MTTYGPYSPIRQAGNLYFVAGQIGVNPKTKTAERDIVSQTSQTLENLKQLLANQGLTMDDIVKTTVYVKNMSDFAAVNEIYISFFSEPRPARATVEVAALPNVANEELLIEIEAVACKP